MPIAEMVEHGTRIAMAAGLLAAYPDALVVAAGEDGLSVPMPLNVGLGRHRVAEGRSLLDLIVPADMAPVIHMWHDVLTAGAAEVSIHLASNPRSRLRLHMVDLRPDFGVLLGIIVPESVDDGPVDVAEVHASRPRYTSLRQNNRALMVDCEPSFTAMFGWTADEIAGAAALDFIHPDDQTRAIEGWMAMLAGQRPHQMRVRRRCKDGSWLWLDTTLHNYLGQPDKDYVLAEMIDVSVEMAAQEALAAREQLLDRLAEALPVGIFQVGPDRRVIYTNERLHQMLGVAPTAELDELLATVVPEDRTALDMALKDVLRGIPGEDVEIGFRPSEPGQTRRGLVSSRALDGQSGGIVGAIVCISDITDSARMRAELEERAAAFEDQATFDTLTRCYNRGSIMLTLERELARQGDSRTGVIFLDLDEFKAINDRHGHAAGDQVLAMVGARLIASIGADDMVGRIGGDEFVVVCPNVADPVDAMTIAEAICAALAVAQTAVSLPTKGTATGFRASMGVACSRPGMTADTLVARADEAMYHSKREGRGEPVLYRKDLPVVADAASRRVRHARVA
jgi:diguanylate cyclase (GGDEF)-like protein/PAS domain S-box-containing protein